jgi:hypothetical protein
VAQVTLRDVRGTACKGCIVEVFSDPAGEADAFEGAVTASPTDGTFLFRKSADFMYRMLTLTASSGSNTSALSAAKIVPKPTVEPSPTSSGAPSPTPTVRPTQDPSAWSTIWLPALRSRD